ncbi:uncharacterized protein MYCFIDRAFT_212770 [Pseudocercospora fijiensis CIRAD86]|uniref:Uncharacterized protein n=1 Tax=Pseudocercospora fijiensis (strain CIRAD86) TaxID=383855 RepID=M2YG76_PSEFD|nr:uncharacterized protein MYCFIDRAFT_212770 [Pseudocercospora fijiensis CIRAD86]EME76805.1 hypothetical protein MYCFIDRAFT_212770 [Pseudocercospora fijiensis CIRAD86]
MPPEDFRQCTDIILRALLSRSSPMMLRVLERQEPSEAAKDGGEIPTDRLASRDEPCEAARDMRIEIGFPNRWVGMRI